MHLLILPTKRSKKKPPYHINFSQIIKLHTMLPFILLTLSVIWLIFCSSTQFKGVTINFFNYRKSSFKPPVLIKPPYSNKPPCSPKFWNKPPVQISPSHSPGGLFELYCFSGGLFEVRVKGYKNYKK